MGPLVWPIVIGSSHITRALIQAYLVDRSRFGDGTPVRVVFNEDYIPYSDSLILHSPSMDVGLPAKHHKSSGGKSDSYIPGTPGYCRKGFYYDPKSSMCLRL